MRKQTKRQPAPRSTWSDRLVTFGKVAGAVYSIVQLGAWLIARIPF